MAFDRVKSKNSEPYKVAWTLFARLAPKIDKNDKLCANSWREFCKIADTRRIHRITIRNPILLPLGEVCVCPCDGTAIPGRHAGQ